MSLVPARTQTPSQPHFPPDTESRNNDDVSMERTSEEGFVGTVRDRDVGMLGHGHGGRIKVKRVKGLLVEGKG